MRFMIYYFQDVFPKLKKAEFPVSEGIKVGQIGEYDNFSFCKNNLTWSKVEGFEKQGDDVDEKNIWKLKAFEFK